MSGSRQQNVIDVASIGEGDLRASVHADGQHFEHLFQASHEAKKKSCKV